MKTRLCRERQASPRSMLPKNCWKSATMRSKTSSSKSTRSILLTAMTTWRTPSRAVIAGVAAGLRKDAFAGVDEDDGDVGGGGAGGHVAGVLLVAGGVGDDELAACGGEVAVGDVDGDALLALGAEAVGEQREIEHAGAGGALAFDGLELVFVDALGVVEEATDEGGFAVVDGAGGGEAEEVFAALCGEVGVDSKSGSARSAARPGETESGSAPGCGRRAG